MKTKDLMLLIEKVKGKRLVRSNDSFSLFKSCRVNL